MTDLIEWMADANSKCPLTIECAEFKDPQLSLWGEGWSFSTNSPWRLIRDYMIKLGSLDDVAEQSIRGFVDSQVVEFRELKSAPNFDIGLRLSNGDELQILCASTDENWVLRVPELPTMPFVPAS